MNSSDTLYSLSLCRNKATTISRRRATCHHFSTSTYLPCYLQAAIFYRLELLQYIVIPTYHACIIGELQGFIYTLQMSINVRCQAAPQGRQKLLCWRYLQTEEELLPFLFPTLVYHISRPGGAASTISLPTTAGRVLPTGRAGYYLRC